MIVPLKKVHDQDLKRIVLANAVGSSALTVSIGDSIAPGATTHTKYATNATTSSKILGIVVALIQSGRVCEKTSVTGVNATTATNGTAVVSNDNETTQVWSVDYIPSYIPMEYEADIDAVAGTTTDDSGQGTYFTITSGTPGLILNSSALIWSTAVASGEQFTSMGYSPYNTKKIRVRVSPTFII